MAVQDYFDSPVAYNPDADQLVAGASFQVYAVTDTAMTTPLSPLDAVSGTPIANLRSSSIGVLPAFRVAGDPPQVILRSGTFTTLLTSKYGIFLDVVPDPSRLDAAVAAAGQAEAAAGLADVARQLALEAASKVSVTYGQATIDPVEGLALDLITFWGIDDNGPYWDDEGPTTGEEAFLSIENGVIGWRTVSDITVTPAPEPRADLVINGGTP